MSRPFQVFYAVFIPALCLGIFLRIYVDKPDWEGAARKAAVKTDISMFTQALGQFQVDCGRYPTTEEGLAALIERPPSIPTAQWRHPYLNLQKIPTDPWGRPFIYKSPGSHYTNAYDCYSVGPEGRGGINAIGNWTPPARSSH
jgi:type II secretion system protein G